MTNSLSSSYYYSSCCQAKGLRTLMKAKSKSSYKLKFALRFIPSLMKIKRGYDDDHDHDHDHDDEIRKRMISKRIKLAAYSSMARAIGTRKAWSRALLFKLHKYNYQRKPNSKNLVVKKKRSLLLLASKKKKKTKKRDNYIVNNNIIVNEKAERLREVVPGGKDMVDICSLFEETAHFIKSLTLQVQLMRDIVNHFSS